MARRPGELLQSDHFPLVVLDWMLPGVDGLELCRRVRAQPGGDRVFLLVTTGRNRRQDLADALDAGADDYVPKPFELSQLEARLTIAERRVAERIARVQATSQTLALIEATRVVAVSAGRDLEATLAALARQARQALGDRPGRDRAGPGRRPGQRAGGRPTFVGDHGADAATRAEMVVPLRSGEELVGLLRVGWANPRTLAPRELEVAAAFGEHAAIAIRTARLVEASERAQRMIVTAEDRERRAVAERLHSRVKSKLVVVWYRLDQCAKLLPADLGAGPRPARPGLRRARADPGRGRRRDRPAAAPDQGQLRPDGRDRGARARLRRAAAGHGPRRSLGALARPLRRQRDPRRGAAGRLPNRRGRARQRPRPRPGEQGRRLAEHRRAAAASADGRRRRRRRRPKRSSRDSA